MKTCRIKLPESYKPLMTAYLEHIRENVAPKSVYNHDYHLRLFFNWLARRGIADVEKIEPKHVILYMRAASKKYKPGTINGASSAIRSLGLYLRMKGFGHPKLADSVPRIKMYRLRNVPNYLTVEQEKKYLNSFDRSTLAGKRNYAIGILLIKMGLRAREVSTITLDDIDWKNAVLRIQNGKGRRVDRLPLLPEVAEAIADYVQYGRAKTEYREVFLKLKFGKDLPMRSGTVNSGIRPTLAQFGINLPNTGTHLLRRTVASRMIQNGASIKEIADVLRHRDIDTSLIYTKINIPLLRQVSMPWPIQAGGLK